MLRSGGVAERRVPMRLIRLCLFVGGIVTTPERIYFTGTTAGDDEPWVSDGTPAGTHLLADLEHRDDVIVPQSRGRP